MQLLGKDVVLIRTDNSTDDDSIYKPFTTTDIPDEVDADALNVLAATLGEDMKSTAEVNPFAAQQPIQDSELEEALGAHSRFKDLVPQSDVVAVVEAGIDVVANSFASTTAATFEACKKVNSRRNVLARTQRSSGGKFAPPDYNDDMREKFEDIWHDPKVKNPFQRGTMHEWCECALSEYERWRHLEIIAAEDEKKAIPPLLETNYQLVSKWAKERKAKSNKVQRAGAFNTQSSILSSQLNSFTPTTASLEDLNMGETTTAADLSVMVVTDTNASAVELPSPTSNQVQRDMEVMVSKPPPTKKRRTKLPPLDKEFLRSRQKLAAEVIERHNISANSAAKGRRR
jgi:hypothetical protein